MSHQLQVTLAIPEELVAQLAQQIAEQLTPHHQDAAAAPPVSPWLTFSQACAYLGMSRNALYKLTAARAVPCRKKEGGQGLRFHRGELDEWLRERYPRLDRGG